MHIIELHIPTSKCCFHSVCLKYYYCICTSRICSQLCSNRHIFTRRLDRCLNGHRTTGIKLLLFIPSSSIHPICFYIMSGLATRIDIHSLGAAHTSDEMLSQPLSSPPFLKTPLVVRTFVLQSLQSSSLSFRIPAKPCALDRLLIRHNCV